MESKFNKYDEIVNSTFIGIYSRSKEKNIIRLIGLDPFNKSHLAIFQISKYVADTFGFTIEVYCSVPKFLYLKLRYSKKRQLKWTRDLNGIYTKSLINSITEAYNVDPDIFSKIYEEYYQ